MTDKFYITNKSGQSMLATISDTYTGAHIITCKLSPGPNELDVANLMTGIYMICLENENHEVFYTQTITKS